MRDGEPVPYSIDNAKCKMNNEELWVPRTAVCMRDVEDAVPYGFCDKCWFSICSGWRPRQPESVR